MKCVLVLSLFANACAINQGVPKAQPSLEESHRLMRRAKQPQDPPDPSDPQPKHMGPTAPPTPAPPTPKPTAAPTPWPTAAPAPGITPAPTEADGAPLATDGGANGGGDEHGEAGAGANGGEENGADAGENGGNPDGGENEDAEGAGGAAGGKEGEAGEAAGGNAEGDAGAEGTDEAGDSFFTVKSGPCTVDPEDDKCIMSPNWPEEYGSKEACEIVVDKDGFLNAAEGEPAFHTEGHSDILSVNCNTFSGASGPSNIQVSDGAELMWSSDDETPSSGWKICASDAGSGDVFKDPEGPCSLSDNCWTSPNFPSEYGNDQECTIHTNKAAKLSAEGTFQTQDEWDYLEVINSGDCQTFSGYSGPSNLAVKPGVKVHWHADEDTAETGWKVCWSEAEVARSGKGQIRRRRR